MNLWTVTHQAPLSMGFSKQEYWNGLPCPPPGDLPDPGMEPGSLMFPVLVGRFFIAPTAKSQNENYLYTNENEFCRELTIPVQRKCISEFVEERNHGEDGL